MAEAEQKNILIVDDDEGSLFRLREVLGKSGYNVITAQDGAEALRELEDGASKFDVVLLDKVMPGLDGFEVLRWIKGDRALQHLPVIMQTGASKSSDIAEGIRLGAFHYLIKPYDNVLLKAVVRSAIDDLELYQSLRTKISEKVAATGLLKSATFEFRTLEEARYITTLLAQACLDPGRVVVGLVELLINAIEHGNLGIGYKLKGELLSKDDLEGEIDYRLTLPQYCDRVATVTFERNETQTVFTIFDQGDGFDWPTFTTIDPKRLADSHGRGIALAGSVSFDSLEYFGTGNKLRAVING